MFVHLFNDWLLRQLHLILAKCLLYPRNLGEVVADMLDAIFQQLFERESRSIGILPDPLKLRGSQIFQKRQHAGPQHLNRSMCCSRSNRS